MSSGEAFNAKQWQAEDPVSFRRNLLAFVRSLGHAALGHQIDLSQDSLDLKGEKLYSRRGAFQGEGKERGCAAQ